MTVTAWNHRRLDQDLSNHSAIMAMGTVPS